MTRTSRYKFIDDKVSPSSSLIIVCLKCNRINKVGSHYCDQCGHPLSPACKKCGNSKNLPSAKFCNRCGIKIEKQVNENDRTNKQYQRVYSNNKPPPNFLECLSLKYNIRFKYPSTFLRAEKPLNESSIVMVFQDNDRGLYTKQPPTIALSIRELKSDKLNLKRLTEIEIQSTLSRQPEAVITGCFPIILGKNSAYQVIYVANKIREISIYTLNRKRLYIITFKTEENTYIQLLYLFEQLKESVEFLS